ncbi:kinase-like protein [Ceratobasidium sp. AG-I]|nr:kinase-like protein [Ceratobasidium sp. AG-I]
MPSIRDSISSVKGHLGLPTSSSRRQSRPASPNPSTHARSSRPPSRSEDVDMQDATSTVDPATSSSPPPTLKQPTHHRHSSLGVPSINEPQFPRSRSPSIAPMPDNEVQAQASLSTQCAMSFAAVVQELAPIPAIGPLIGCLTFVFQAVEKTRVNKEQWDLLRGRCVMVTRIAGAQVTNYGGPDYPGLNNSAKTLHDTITNIGERAVYFNNMHEIFALLQYQSISEEIRGHFAQLDVCLRMFSYASDVAQMQWIGEFSAVQRAELQELADMKKLIVGLSGNVDTIGKTNDEVKSIVIQVDAKLQKVLDDNTEILQNQRTTTMASYTDAEKIVKTIRTVTKLQPPPQILLGRQCIPESKLPIKTGVTCDIYVASFLGGEKVAKKVFRIGTSDEEHVKKYAERFLRDAKLWWTFRSDYTLPFYGVGMEAYESDKHFQLYMVSPLMKNFDAVTYLKQYRTNAGINQNILRIITDAARGLQYLHKREPAVVHSGMRGDNILIKDSGGAVLGGFGLTKALQGGSSTENGSGNLLPAVMTGKTESQRWMAPEMFEDDQPVLQTPSDIWGWAMAAVELVSGNVPYFKTKQTHSLAVQIGRGKRPARKDHVEFDKYALQPDELWALLERCWAIEASERPTIDEVIAELERIKAMTNPN